MLGQIQEHALAADLKRLRDLHPGQLLDLGQVGLGVVPHHIDLARGQQLAGDFAARHDPDDDFVEIRLILDSVIGVARQARDWSLNSTTLKGPVPIGLVLKLQSFILAGSPALLGMSSSPPNRVR